MPPRPGSRSRPGTRSRSGGSARGGGGASGGSSRGGGASGSGSHRGSRGSGARGTRAAQHWSARRVAVRTPFAFAEVIPEPDRPWRRLLRLDGEDCSHVDLRDPERIDFAYVRRFADVADLIAPPGRPLRALHLGGGGFTLPRYLAATRPGSRSEVAEIDPGLVDLARAELGLRTDRALRVRVADAREVLARRAPGSADLVVLDAFHGTTVPAHLTTAEFVAAVRRALAPAGAFAANVIDAPPLPVARALLAAVLDRFSHAAIVATRKVVRGRQGGNVVVLASAEPAALPLRQLARRALAGPVPELLVAGPELRAWLGGVPARHDEERDEPVAAAPPAPDALPAPAAAAPPTPDAPPAPAAAAPPAPDAPPAPAAAAPPAPDAPPASEAP